MTMVSFGIGEIVGSCLIGYIIDKFGSKKTAHYNIIAVALTTLLTLVFLSVNRYCWLAHMMTFMWGLQDSFTNTHCLEMLGFEFETNTEPYSVMNLS